MKRFLFTILLFTSLSVVKVNGQIWISGRLNYQPFTYFPENYKYYTFNDNAEFAAIERTYFEGYLGYKFLFIGYSSFTQHYNPKGIDDKTFDYTPFSFLDRELTFNDYIFGLRHETDHISISLYYNYSKFLDERSSLIYIPPTNILHPIFPVYNGIGHGFGFSFGVKIIENLSAGINGNYIYYKDLLEKKIIRINPFIEYKYNFKWKK